MYLRTSGIVCMILYQFSLFKNRIQTKEITEHVNSKYKKTKTQPGKESPTTGHIFFQQSDPLFLNCSLAK